MLKLIKCDIFQEKVINFHEGLNVVLGDNAGTNSIGKSTLLMIVDFVFGGSTYITFNKDVVSMLGHHEFNFTFEFDNIEFYFSRNTIDPNRVYKCTKDFEKYEEMKLNVFCKLLKKNYGIESESLSFREAVSTFSRIWGKNNYEVKRLLHVHHSDNNLETVSRLIKLFDEYNKIAEEDKVLKSLKSSKTTLNSAGKLKYIPKITKNAYERNLKEIVKLNTEILNWGKSAYSPNINISEIISDELMELKERKNFLIQEREYYKSRFNRTNKTITNSTDVGFEKLLEYFPQVNIEKLHAIEKFHEGISLILNKEMSRAKKELLQKIESLDEEIREINSRMEKVLNPHEQSNLFIDNLLEASFKLRNIQLENDYYQTLKTVNDDVAAKTITVSEMKETITSKIMLAINHQLEEINKLVYKDNRVAPVLSISSNDYEYSYFVNTGTGKAYANLIIFDLAIFKLTNLPIMIHDSILLKNIEKVTVEKIVNIYTTFKKQIFIAVDEISTYSNDIQNTLLKNKTIQLSNDKLLFTMDWRDSSKTSE